MSVQRIAASESTTSHDGVVGRLLLWLALTLVAILAAYVLLRGAGLITPGALLPSRLAEAPLWDLLDDAPWQPRLIATGIALLVGLGALGALARWGVGSGARGSDGRRALHVLEADERGLVLMESDGIEAVVCTAVRGTPGVFDASARAKPRGRGVALSLDISVLEDADVRRAAMAARDRAVTAIERLVGLDVQGVQVRVEVISTEQLGRALR